MNKSETNVFQLRQELLSPSMFIITTTSSGISETVFSFVRGIIKLVTVKLASRLTLSLSGKMSSKAGIIWQSVLKLFSKSGLLLTKSPLRVVFVLFFDMSLTKNCFKFRNWLNKRTKISPNSFWYLWSLFLMEANFLDKPLQISRQSSKISSKAPTWVRTSLKKTIIWFQISATESLSMKFKKSTKNRESSFIFKSKSKSTATRDNSENTGKLDLNKIDFNIEGKVIWGLPPSNISINLSLAFTEPFRIKIDSTTSCLSISNNDSNNFLALNLSLWEIYVNDLSE